jgi:Domain of unknown function (DUF6815)
MKRPTVALLWRGGVAEREVITVAESRLAMVGAALAEVGIDAQPAVYDDHFVDAVRDQLMAVDGVLVWVNPMDEAGDRSALNGLLREVASRGVMVSAHPDVIDAIGTKEVLFRTRHLRFGSDVRLYASSDQLRSEFPRSLAGGETRVLKPSRGNGGSGVWSVALDPPPQVSSDVPPDATSVKVRHAARGSIDESMSLQQFLELQETAFANGGTMIDQVYEPRLVDGMIRCYLVRDRVAGFGEQLVNALYPIPAGASPPDVPQPDPRRYFPPTRVDLQDLRREVEDLWVGELCSTVGIEARDLPVLWDADFLHTSSSSASSSGYVLCEINVSSVYPFPDDAVGPLSHEVRRRLVLDDQP